MAAIALTGRETMRGTAALEASRLLVLRAGRGGGGGGVLHLVVLVFAVGKQSNLAGSTRRFRGERATVTMAEQEGGKKLPHGWSILEDDMALWLAVAGVEDEDEKHGERQRNDYVGGEAQ